MARRLAPKIWVQFVQLPSEIKIVLLSIRYLSVAHVCWCLQDCEKILSSLMLSNSSECVLGRWGLDQKSDSVLLALPLTLRKVTMSTRSRCESPKPFYKDLLRRRLLMFGKLSLLLEPMASLLKLIV